MEKRKKLDILLLEDDYLLADYLEKWLKRKGDAVDTVHSVAKAAVIVQQKAHDLYILDICTRDLEEDGITLAEYLGERAIIFITNYIHAIYPAEINALSKYESISKMDSDFSSKLDEVIEDCAYGRRRDLKFCIDENILRARERKAWMWRKEGKTIKEIASLWGVNIKTVYKYFYRAIDKVRENAKKWSSIAKTKNNI